MHIYIVHVTTEHGIRWTKAYQDESEARRVMWEETEVGDTITFSRAWLSD